MESESGREAIKVTPFLCFKGPVVCNQITPNASNSTYYNPVIVMSTYEEVQTLSE